MGQAGHAAGGRAQQRRWWLGVSGASMALALGLLLHGPSGSQGHRADLWGTAAPTRPLDARLTRAEVDFHRPHAPDARWVTTLPRDYHAVLARMREAGDLHGVATAWLLRGALQASRGLLEQLPPSPERDSDLALIALEEDRPDEALGLLEGVLRQRPDHPQAAWNQALALERLGLTLLAADSFEAVARRGEPGWSAEALERMRARRDEGTALGRSWAQAFEAGQALLEEDGGAKLPLEAAKRHPGLMRAFFYDAVRAAPSRERVERLMPLAGVLDGLQGDGVLKALVQRTAQGDFSRRRQLAPDYARLARREHPAPEAFLEVLRRSGEEDLYLGALLELGATEAHLDAFVRLARARKDPWFDLLAEQELAAGEARAGDWLGAEARLREALRACPGRSLAWRCLHLTQRLTELFLQRSRPAEALASAREGWRLARVARDWDFERVFIQHLARLTRLQGRHASTRAYLRESLARDPDSCAQRAYVHRQLASLAFVDFQEEEARRELDGALQAMACGESPGVAGAVLLSDLARYEAPVCDADAYQRQALAHRVLAGLRGGRLRPGGAAMLRYAEAQFELARDAGAGHALLRRALEEAEQLPHVPEARKARAYVLATLATEAGRRGDFPEALGHVARSLDLHLEGRPPARCALAVAVDHERTVVVARGPDGGLAGHFDAGRTAPLGPEASGLVPPSLVRALRGCAHVDVLAMPPVHGLAGLLPPEVAWSYRVGGTGHRLPAPDGTHLVVSGVQVPRMLGLEWLRRQEPPPLSEPGRVELGGTEATPSRVLREMVRAREIELHTHGLFNPEQSDAALVVLAPERGGHYALTADLVRSQRLEGAPLVLLATCQAARAAGFPAEPRSLPVAFIQAGASAVVAATVDIPDSAADFFTAVREHVRQGALPSVALRDVRQQWLAEQPDVEWVQRVLLFE